MNASIRLRSPFLLAALSLLSVACVGGTRVGATAPRLVREPLVAFDDGAMRSTSALSPAARPPEHLRSRAVRPNVSGLR